MVASVFVPITTIVAVLITAVGAVIVARAVDAEEVLELSRKMARFAGVFPGKTGEVPTLLGCHGGRTGGEQLSHGDCTERIDWGRGKTSVFGQEDGLRCPMPE